MAKLGRPPKVKTGIEPIAPALWDRVRRNVASGLLPAIHGTEVSRLAHHGLITPTEASAAFRLAEVYSRWDTCLGRARTPRSPSYEMGFSGTAPESQKAADERDKAEEKREIDARSQWEALQKMLDDQGITNGERRWLEELCVQNEPIGPLELSDIRPILQGLAQQFRVVSAGKNSALKRAAKDITHSQKPAAAAPQKASDVDRASFLSVISAQLPNLSADQLDSVYLSYCETRTTNTAKRDREAFREEKKETAHMKRKP